MQYFHSLGKMNTCLYQDEFTNDMQSHVKYLRNEDIMNEMGGNNQKHIENFDVKLDDVIDAIKLAKNNKSLGLDLITNELIKNGGDLLNKSSFVLFPIFINWGKTAEEWNKGIIIPIFKKGDKKDLDNYRGITLPSCVSKIFNRIIAKSISKLLEDHDALSEIQGDSERIIDAKTISLRSRASLQQDWRKIIQHFLLSWISERRSTRFGEMGYSGLLGI